MHFNLDIFGSLAGFKSKKVNLAHRDKNANRMQGVIHVHVSNARPM